MHISAYLLIWALCSGYTIVAGGKPERLGAALLLWLTAAPIMVRQSHFDREVGYSLIDLLVLFGCLYLALSNKRQWTKWFCSAQIVAVLGHVAHALLTREAGFAYGLMTRVPAYLQCGFLMVGTYQHTRTIRAGTQISP